MTKEQLSKTGFGVAIAGFVVSTLSLVPAFSANQWLPWPLIAGSMMYVLGFFYCVGNSKREEVKGAISRLRVVRIGIFIIVLILIQKMITRQ